MSFHSQQESFSPFSQQKSKYTNKSQKKKKHDSDTKSKKSKSKLHKSITKQIRSTLLKEFELKYAEKEKTTSKNVIKIRNETKMGQ